MMAQAFLSSKDQLSEDKKHLFFRPGKLSTLKSAYRVLSAEANGQTL